MNILLLTTPFHLLMINKCRFLLKDEPTYLFYSKHLDIAEIEEKFKNIHADFFKIPGFDNSKLPKSMFSLKRRFKLRSYYLELLKYIETIDFNKKIHNVIIFSEKDLFTQILLKKFKNSNIIAIDEGTGYYNKDSYKDKIKKILYLVISPLLFSGFTYRYFVVLGTHPSIKEVYIRRPELIYTLREKIEYHQIENDSIRKLSLQTTEKSILVLTSPIYEDEKLPQGEAFDLLRKTMSILSNRGYIVYLKTHPREKIDKYSDLIQEYQLKTIPKNKRSEDLDYFEYSYIVNFFSSSIIDILEKEYPAERIISIYPSRSFSNRKHIFKSTNIIYKIEEMKNIIV